MPSISPPVFLKALSLILFMASAVPAIALPKDNPDVDQVQQPCRQSSKGLLRSSKRKFFVQGTDRTQAALTIHSNTDFYCEDNGSTQAVIVIHGSNRNAEHYYKVAMDAAKKSVDVTERTIVLAPFFATEGDRVRRGNNLMWEMNDDWKEGNPSLQGVSSFAAMDQLINHLNDSRYFPHLSKVVLVGHSAGGQYVNRYAAGSRVEDHSRVPVTYVVASPSSYLYLNPVRCSRFGSEGCEEFKADEELCAEFNDYRYGLSNKNDYMSELTNAMLQTNLIRRNVLYFIGARDNSDEGGFDQSCAASLQGSNRLQRAKTYFSHLAQYFPQHRSLLTVVPNADHSFRRISLSPKAQCILFGKNCEEDALPQVTSN